MSATRPPLQTDVALVARIEDGTLLVAGLGDEIGPAVGVLIESDPKRVVTAPAVSAPLAHPTSQARFAFVVVLQQPPARLRQITLCLPGRTAPLTLPERAAGLGAMFAALAEEAGEGFDRLVDGLLEILLADGASPARVRAAIVLVEVAARRAGFIELSGRAAPDEIFVQGWATDLPAGRMRVLAAAEPPLMTEFLCATHERPDLGGRGRGFLGLLRPAPVTELESLRWLFFRTGDGWRALDLYEQHRRIEPHEIPGHVRSRLTAAGGPPDVLAGLRHASRRFGGRETLSDLPMPVRLGIDLALRAEGSGVFLAGWLLDPTDKVRTVRLVSGGESVVISGDWSRIPRKDVEDTFAANPLFHGKLPARTPPGFLSFAPRFAADKTDPLHLALDLGDETPPAYFPLTLAASPPRRAVARLLASLDPRSVAASGAPDHQIEPMLRAAKRPQPGKPEIRDIGFAETGPVTLVVGADDERVSDLGHLLAILATDRSVRTLPIAIAAPGAALALVSGEIERLSRFYGLNVRLVFADAVDDVFDALEAGVAATEAGTLALLSAHVLPVREGWLPELLAAHRRSGGRLLVCPTILYEDGSVRWAGTLLGENGDRRAISQSGVGFPRSALAGVGAQEVSAGTLEACVGSRAAFAALEGLGHGYLTPAARNLDMAFRIRLNGTPAVWLPEVEMIASDGTVAPPGSREIHERIDRTLFDQSWSLAIANLRR